MIILRQKEYTIKQDIASYGFDDLAAQQYAKDRNKIAAQLKKERRAINALNMVNSGKMRHDKLRKFYPILDRIQDYGYSISPRDNALTNACYQKIMARQRADLSMQARKKLEESAKNAANKVVGK